MTKFKSQDVKISWFSWGIFFKGDEKLFIQKQPPEVFKKKSYLLKFPNIHRKPPVLDHFLIKLQTFRPAILLKRNSNTDVSYEYCKIFKNTYFEEHLRTPASGWSTLKWYTYIVWRRVENGWFCILHFDCLIS